MCECSPVGDSLPTGTNTGGGTKRIHSVVGGASLGVCSWSRGEASSCGLLLSQGSGWDTLRSTLCWDWDTLILYGQLWGGWKFQGCTKIGTQILLHLLASAPNVWGWQALLWDEPPDSGEQKHVGQDQAKGKKVEGQTACLEYWWAGSIGWWKRLCTLLK